MKKRKMAMTVIVTFCLIILFIPMNFANAGSSEDTNASGLSTSLAGALVTSGAENISQEINSLTTTNTENVDESPDTSDKTPIFVVSTIAVVSFISMATVCLKEYSL